MPGVEVAYTDVDGDGDREVVVENRWLRSIIRMPDSIGEEMYGHRWSWGGRLQSLVYRPTGREYFKTTMIDPENNRPFGLPDELFASFELPSHDGLSRRLKMGVGVFTSDSTETRLEPIPWTWFMEDHGEETVVVFRQEAQDLDGLSFRYDKRYRFRPDSAWFAMDIEWTNNGKSQIASDWDIHSFHVSGAPPESAWLVAPKRAWATFGNTRLRTVMKEPSAIFARPEEDSMVADTIVWDLDGPGWWYALGPPGPDEEFYLLNGRFEPYRGLFWHGWHAFTPQGINHVEVPPGETAKWGFDVTLGVGGKHFVKAAEDTGLTVQRPEDSNVVVVAVHAASKRRGDLKVHVLDQHGRLSTMAEKHGEMEPGKPLQEILNVPPVGDYATVEAVFEQDGRTILSASETIPLSTYRPTALLPFQGNGSSIHVSVDSTLEYAETDGRYLHCHGVEAGFDVDWSGTGVDAPDSLQAFAVIAIVGDAWPGHRAHELRDWVLGGGGLLYCAPAGSVAESIEDILPLRQDGPGTKMSDGTVGLVPREPHITADRLMLHPDAAMKIAWRMPATAHPDATVTLGYSDNSAHPACAVLNVGRGRVAALSTRPAWGAGYRNAIWDGWGQYHRAFYAGLFGWLAGIWEE
jgi:hypothetical protein